jgi:predicted nuclease of restriction endonuclease-like (RecB) superfamily
MNENKIILHSNEEYQTSLYQNIAQILQEARQRSYKAINLTMLEAYWSIGQQIVEEEQRGKHRAEYGAKLLPYLAQNLQKEFGRGFDQSNLRNMRMFYNAFPIRDAVRNELTWTHYRILLKVSNEKARAFYIKESIDNQWNTRALERNINTFYYERILSSNNQTLVKAESESEQIYATDIIKDPYILEFLDLGEKGKIKEKTLEQALIDQLQLFLLELGKGFSFVARQKRIAAEEDYFTIDLVFYNYVLKCFVLIDLKIGKLTHGDIGQMDFYVRYWEDNFKTEGDNPTIGLVLCTEKNETVVKYSVLQDNQQLFVSKYKLFLPTEEELRRELEREKQFLAFREENKKEE